MLKINRSPKPNKVVLPGSMLYKEDMKELFSTLKRRSPEGEINVKIFIDGGEYEIDELEDFDNPNLDGKRFRDMKFEAFYEGSSIVIELLPESGSILEVRKDEDIMMTGVSDKVEEIARKREDHLRFFGLFILSFLAIFPLYLLAQRFLVGPIVGLTELLGFSESRAILVDSGLLALVGAVFVIPVLVYVLKKMRIKGNTLVNSSRGKSKMLRDRLQDNWQVSAFWAIFSAVLGFLLGRIL